MLKNDTVVHALVSDLKVILETAGWFNEALMEVGELEGDPDSLYRWVVSAEGSDVSWVKEFYALPSKGMMAPELTAFFKAWTLAFPQYDAFTGDWVEFWDGYCHALYKVLKFYRAERHERDQWTAAEEWASDPGHRRVGVGCRMTSKTGVDD